MMSQSRARIGTKKMITLIDLASISMAALLGAAVILATLGYPRKHKASTSAISEKDVVLLFRDGAVLDATQDAFDLFGHEVQGIAEVWSCSIPAFPTSKA